MAEYWVNRSTGSDSGTGSESDPWYTIPGMTGGNSVTAGDTINVANGHRYPGRLALTANNLTYRGYGVASNVLMLQIPHWLLPDVLIVKRVCRQAGTHEGMWIVDALGETSQGAINYSTRTGCVIEDACVINATSMSSAVSIGTSAQAQIGATIRRCLVDGAVVGISCYRPNTLIEDTAVRNTSDDGITIGTGASQSFHAGNTVTLRRVSLQNNGFDTASAVGDAVQLFNSTGFQGTMRLEQSLIQREAQIKQGVMLGALSGVVEILGCHFDGQGVGSTQIGVAEMTATGVLRVKRNYWQGSTSNGNPLVRMAAGESGSTGTMADGATILMENNVADFDAYGGLFSWGSASTGTLAGDVTVRNNTCRGVADNGLSWSAAVGAQTAGTVGATASMTVENNAFIGASPVVFRMPASGENDARWVFRGNRIDGAAAACVVGASAGTSYATVAEFEAAHSYASVNSEGECQVTNRLTPKPGSPLLDGGYDAGSRRDIRRLQSRRHVGAYGNARLVEAA